MRRSPRSFSVCANAPGIIMSRAAVTSSPRPSPPRGEGEEDPRPDSMRAERALSRTVAAAASALAVRFAAQRAQALVAAAADAVEVLQKLAKYREVVAARFGLAAK